MEDESRARLHSIFARAGWTVEDLAHDYGEDLLVRIFDKGRATPLAFFVQAKATDHIERYISRDGKELLYPLSSEHLKHWSQFWEPVILTVWDAHTDTTYWEMIQTFLERGDVVNRMAGGPANLTVLLSTSNTLNSEGVQRIRVRTRERFARFEREAAGAKRLIDILRETFGISIDYNSQSGIIIMPKGTFVAAPEKGLSVHFFGRAATMIDRIAGESGRTAQSVLEASLDFYKQVVEAFDSDGKLIVRDASGAVIETWTSLDELNEHVSRSAELVDDDEPLDIKSELQR